MRFMTLLNRMMFYYLQLDEAAAVWDGSGQGEIG